jgi:hypothetical protein
LVRRCVPIPQKIYGITRRIQTPEEVEQYFPGFIAFVDCTQQQIPRPVDNKRKKTFYLGKKKTYSYTLNRNKAVLSNYARDLVIYCARI